MYWSCQIKIICQINCVDHSMFTKKEEKSSFINNEKKKDVFEGKKLNTMTPAKIVV